MLDRSSFAAIALAAGLWATTADAQIVDLSKYPDLSGQWSRVPDGGVPRYDPSKPLYKQEAPLKPEYQARWEASVKDIQAGGFGLDTHYALHADGNAAADVWHFADGVRDDAGPDPRHL